MPGILENSRARAVAVCRRRNRAGGPERADLSISAKKKPGVA